MWAAFDHCFIRMKFLEFSISWWRCAFFSKSINLLYFILPMIIILFYISSNKKWIWEEIGDLSLHWFFFRNILFPINGVYFIYLFGSLRFYIKINTVGTFCFAALYLFRFQIWEQKPYGFIKKPYGFMHEIEKYTGTVHCFLSICTEHKKRAQNILKWEIFGKIRSIFFQID